MRNSVLLPALIAAIAAVPALAEEIYRWADQTGQVHYSDIPRDGAERVELDPAQTFSSPEVARPAPSSTVLAEPVVGYAGLTIVSPSQEETIWNTGGVITIAVDANPGLKPGHSISILYDGNELQKAPQATTAQLSEVYRGEHRIGAEIRDETGTVLQRATPVTFFYRQAAGGS